MNRLLLMPFMVLLHFTVSLSLCLNSQASPLKTTVFTSLNNPSNTIDLKTAKLEKTTYMAHDCKGCHQLLKELKKNCSSLGVTTFAVGNKKNLKSKLKILNKLKSPVYLGPTTQAYSDIGIDLMPYYISSKGERHEYDVFSAMVKDGVCKSKNEKKK